MICTSKKQATEVAEKNMAEMAAQGYQAFQGTMNPSVWRCYRPEAERTPARPFYRVELGPKPTCNCEFFRLNRPFGICKHLLFCQAEAIAQAWCREQGTFEQLYPFQTAIAANFAVSPNAIIAR